MTVRGSGPRLKLQLPLFSKCVVLSKSYPSLSCRHCWRGVKDTRGNCRSFVSQPPSRPRRQLTSGCTGAEPLQGAHHSVWVAVYSIQAQLPALEAKPETNKYRLPRCACGLRGPPWYTGRSLGCPPSSHSLQAWHHSGTHRNRDRSCALPAPAPSFSVQGPALPLAGRWGGRMGARVQVPGCRLGSLFKDRGAGRQAPRASRLLCATICLRCPTVARPHSHCGPPATLPPRST